MCASAGVDNDAAGDPPRASTTGGRALLGYPLGNLAIEDAGVLPIHPLQLPTNLPQSAELPLDAPGLLAAPPAEGRPLALQRPELADLHVHALFGLTLLCHRFGKLSLLVPALDLQGLELGDVVPPGLLAGAARRLQRAVQSVPLLGGLRLQQQEVLPHMLAREVAPQRARCPPLGLRRVPSLSRAAAAAASQEGALRPAK
mmetsp:Transcript_51486/g.149571  ORF Transcript_51486/g.149571 Transcript_51486/m.149571 type:complete len:201 (-) Transcript_51486:259-861(-)